ncbi:unannotated protein [freshwater metagenome]|uniref:Unannotated protein n=1 Tax=freshwater metagenome TaxID=449393 RepID=A0A6J7H4V2_9ZZZZ
MAPRCVGLSFQRPQLPTNLTEQVLDTCEVGFSSCQAALGTLFAATKFENTCSLFDDESAILGAGIEHTVDISLRDDDMLLPADSGVREQFLDVEQAARHIINRILTIARAKEQSAQRDLSEVDWQQASRVIDGERNLGTTQRWAVSGPRKNDIIHFCRAHNGWLLSAKHPSNGINHV